VRAEREQRAREREQELLPTPAAEFAR
jgi:hypothetical protein